MPMIGDHVYFKNITECLSSSQKRENFDKYGGTIKTAPLIKGIRVLVLLLIDETVFFAVIEQKSR